MISHSNAPKHPTVNPESGFLSLPIKPSSLMGKAGERYFKQCRAYNEVLMILYDLEYDITDFPHFFDTRAPIESLTFAGAAAMAAEKQMIIIDSVVSASKRRDWTDETETFHAMVTVRYQNQTRVGASSWKNHPMSRRFAELDAFRNAVRHNLLQEGE